MSHIDEGTLHAYLDGALDLYPTEEADRVRRHLESCAECRERLEEERAIRDEANTILGSSVPDLAPPPFEELRAEAARRGTPAQTSGLSRMRRWAWAASVVLALGTGWMLRGSISGFVSQPGPQEEAAEPSVTAPAAADEALVSSDPAEASGQTRDEVPVEEPPPATLEDRPAQAPAPTPVEVAEETPAAPEPDVAVKEAEADVAAGTVAAGTGAAAAPAEEAREVVAAGARRTEVVPSAADFDAPLRRAREVPPAAGLVDGALAVDSLVVPGLTFLGVLPGFASFPEGSVVVRQLTETGDTLDVIGLPVGAEPPLVSRPTREGWNEVVVLRGEAWVIIRGRMAEEELLAYGERLRGGG